MIPSNQSQSQASLTTLVGSSSSKKRSLSPNSIKVQKNPCFVPNNRKVVSIMTQQSSPTGNKAYIVPSKTHLIDNLLVIPSHEVTSQTKTKK